MASCITSQWVSTAPQVKLIVETESQNSTTQVFRYTLQYIASSAANTSVNKSYSVNIDGKVVKSGTYDIDGKTGTNTICTGTVSKARGSSARSMGFSVEFQFNLTWSGSYKGTANASSFVTVNSLPKYTIKYDANGGTGVPANQTKTYGTSIKLSSTKPSRTGYTFKNWLDETNVRTYGPGETYMEEGNVTLVAQWTVITYTVTYNANGGSGAPYAQTKTYGKALTLSSTKPTRSRYNFLGWATSASGKVAYSSGASYTANAAITLYAVWELAYVRPAIFSVKADRCDSDGELNDSGNCAMVQFKWKTTYANVRCVISYTSASGTLESYPYQFSATEGSVISDPIGGDFSTDSTYTITIAVTDYADNGSEMETVEATATLPGLEFVMDIRAGGKGISFGKPAELDDTADFGWAAKFNKPVYGKALGMDRLPSIPEGGDFNNYLDPGCYAVWSDAIAKTCENNPVSFAGRLEVWSSTGEGVRSQQWSYLRQIYISYRADMGVWQRDIKRGSNNVWTYGEWWVSGPKPQAFLWGDDASDSGMYMSADQSIYFSEWISDQPHGIVIVFSAYESDADTNYGWQSFFIPKNLVNASTSGHTFILGRGKFTRIGTKYLYIYDDHIDGHSDNKLAGEANGISYNNAKFVLRYVIGV